MFNPVEKIYLTYKTRMTAEARLRQAARTWNLAIIWYSFCAIVLSLLDLTGKFMIPYSSAVMAIISIGIFALSLYVSGERYHERADQFRDCYLELQEIYSCESDIAEKMRRYSEVLRRYDNQTNDDYDRMLVEAYFRGQQLRNADGDVAPTKTVLARVMLKQVLEFIGALVIFAAPPLLMVVVIRPAG